jgi:hypothetical protein
MPREYARVLEAYNGATTEAERAGFLERVGVRYFLVPAPPAPDARLVMPVADIDARMALYERPAWAPRAEVVTMFEVQPDEGRAVARVLAPDAPRGSAVLASEPPPAAGQAGAGAAPAAEIALDAPNAVTVRANVPDAGGLLVLRDTFDPNWRAFVDGAEAPVVRADVVFRAVRLAPGAHTVEFRYRSRPLEAGAVVSVVALLALAGVLARTRRARVRR